MSSSTDDSLKSIVRYFALISQIGLQFVLSVLLGLFIGTKIDDICHSSPLFFIIGILVGIIGGGIGVYKLILAAEKRS